MKSHPFLKRMARPYIKGLQSAPITMFYCSCTLQMCMQVYLIKIIIIIINFKKPFIDSLYEILIFQSFQLLFFQ